jgi:hypothetical protein
MPYAFADKIMLRGALNLKHSSSYALRMPLLYGGNKQQKKKDSSIRLSGINPSILTPQSFLIS